MVEKFSLFGVLVNAGAVLVGGLGGMLLRGGIKERYSCIVTQSIGLCVVFLGASSSLGKMILPEANSLLFILSLVIGGLLGEWIGIERRLEKLGDWLQKKTKMQGQHGNVSSGFVAASLLFCVGSMAILGSLDSGLQGDHSTLLAKSVLDGVTAAVMASSLGVGVLFSSVSILLYQGSITLLAGWAAPFISADMIREITIVGGIMIAAIGLNMLEITKIKIGILLPALLGPIVYYLILSWIA